MAAALECASGERVLDVCAAPGGKATAMATVGARVTAADIRPGRARLIAANAARLELDLDVVVADATHPPFFERSFDAVLIDAPCSGLGALRRRPDARWRIQPTDVAELARLQHRIIEATAPLVRPGGRLLYSVCTLTAIESIDHTMPSGFEVDARRPTVGTWRPYGYGWRVLPHDADTDGMMLIRYRRST